MAFTQKRLAGALTSGATQLSTTAAAVYTPGGSPSVTAIVKQIILCNTSNSSSPKVGIYVLPGSETTIANKYALFKNVQLDPNETLILNLSVVLTNGNNDDLYMVCDTATCVTATVYGIEES